MLAGNRRLMEERGIDTAVLEETARRLSEGKTLTFISRDDRLVGLISTADQVRPSSRAACGMQVDPDSAAGTSEYEGETVYFCSSGCKVKFDEEPERYAGAIST